MAEEISDLRRILDGTDWVALDDGSGMTYLDTPVMLEGLTSGDLRLIRAGLLHLESAFIEYPNVFSATVPAIHYVVALLNGSLDGDPVVLNSMGRNWHAIVRLLLPRCGISWMYALTRSIGNSQPTCWTS